jgi:ferrochelatase
MLVVPIAFTSDHIETLHEIDVEFAEVAAKAGVKRFVRAPSLNDEPLLTTAQAELVAAHLASGRATATSQYGIHCAGCTNPECRTIINPVDSTWQSLRQYFTAARSSPSSSASSSSSS